jgi:hypothetical protein
MASFGDKLRVVVQSRLIYGGGRYTVVTLHHTFSPVCSCWGQNVPVNGDYQSPSRNSEVPILVNGNNYQKNNIPAQMCERKLSV